MGKKIISWTINVEYEDGTKKNISDMPKEVSQAVDDYLTELED